MTAPLTENYLTEDDAIAATSGLTRVQLSFFVSNQLVIPLHTTQGPAFRHIDLARLRLLCELTEDLELEAEALHIVMSLLDQLHAARQSLHQIAEVLAEEPADLRARIGAALLKT